jgi:primosomal replication protein N
LNRANRLILDGTLTARDILRHTPAGIAIVEFVLEHESTQAEAGAERMVRLEMSCIAVEEIARVVSASPLGGRVQAAGFLAPKARSSRTPVLHVTDIEFKEGD